MTLNYRKGLMLDFLKPVTEIENQITYLYDLMNYSNHDISQELDILQEELVLLKKEIFQCLTPLQRLHLVRQAERPTTLDYIQYLLDDWIELHGDRGGADDPALVGGIGRLNNRTSGAPLWLDILHAIASSYSAHDALLISSFR